MKDLRTRSEVILTIPLINLKDCFVRRSDTMALTRLLLPSMLTHRFANTIGDLHAVVATACLTRKCNQSISIAGAGVEEHGAAEMRDPESCKILFPAAEPVATAAVLKFGVSISTLR